LDKSLAAGQKVQKTVTTATATIMTDYLDGFQYVNHALNFFPHAEGFVDVKGTNAEGYNYFYVYNYTDHLGNIRVSYGFDPDTKTVKTLEENHYYPFGLKHTNYNTYKRGFKKEDPPTDAPPTSIPGLVVFSIKQVVPGELLVYKYKYNGKEFQDELGLNMYDYHARNYMPDIGRTTTYDPLAEKFYHLSPQSFLNNNPVYFIDPTGMEVISNNFGTTFTGADAAAAFQSLKNQMGSWHEEDDKDDIINLNKDNEVTGVTISPGDNKVFKDGKQLTDLTSGTKKAKGVKKGDKIVEGELFRLIIGVEILRKDIDVFGDDKYGHWWVEIGSESYGWWPKYGVGISDTILGVAGELNGQTSFAGTPTKDPHHGDRSLGVDVFKLYTKGGKSTMGVISSIKNYASSYSGNWSWPGGQNCHSFQDKFINKLNLTINP
jgi:RHS repeat-associated protein